MLTPDIVFIDTSVFIAENDFASGNRIHTLMQLAEESKINLVLSEITVQEVRKHIISSTRDAWKQFDKVCKVFRNREEIDKWRKSTNDKKEINYYLSKLDAFVKSPNIKILDYSYCSDTAQVFTAYFNRQKPFGEGMKKDEFPDAFALAALEKYAGEIKHSIIVLSQDPDMAGYESDALSCQDCGEYVSRKLAEGHALSALDEKLSEEKTSLEEDIKNQVIDYLDDFRLYLTCLRLMDVSDHSVREVEVDLNASNYEVLRIDDECIELELHPEVAFTVDVDYVDYDYAQYDREDGVWYGTENGVYEVNGSTEIRLVLRYYYQGNDETEPELEIADLDMAALMDVIE